MFYVFNNEKHKTIFIVKRVLFFVFKNKKLFSKIITKQTFNFYFHYQFLKTKGKNILITIILNFLIIKNIFAIISLFLIIKFKIYIIKISIYYIICL